MWDWLDDRYDRGFTWFIAGMVCGVVLTAIATWIVCGRVWC